MQLVKQVGEYLVAAELSRRGYISTTFTGNVPEFDILAINEDLKTTPLQVKTVRSGSWQFDASRYIEIDIKDGAQVVLGKKKLSHPDLICVLVKLGENRNDEFYIMRLKNLQSIILRDYKRHLKEKGGKRPKRPDSTHCAIYPRHMQRYKDNWQLIEDAFGKKSRKK